MPTYDYHCDHCGLDFSERQRFADTAIERCPRCGQTPRRLFALPALVFKGSGWYKTDSRKAPPPEGSSPPAKSSEPEAKEGKKKEASSDTPKTGKAEGSSSGSDASGGSRG
jgi:putative FmdB family regulatory protein